MLKELCDLFLLEGALEKRNKLTLVGKGGVCGKAVVTLSDGSMGFISL